MSNPTPSQSSKPSDETIIPCKGYFVRREPDAGGESDGTRRVARINIGCGHRRYLDCVNVDKSDDVGADVVFDLEKTPWPFSDNTFNSVYASHIIEHLREPLLVMQELARVCAPGALAIIRVPYGSSDNAWEDPTHIRPYFLDSFGYFSQAAYGGADYGYRGDWSVADRQLKIVSGKGLHEYTDKLDELLGLVMTHRNIVEELKVVLCNVKPIRSPADAREKAPITFLLPRE